MLGIDVRTARSVWTAALVLVALASIYLARKTLFVFTLAVLLAYLLSPLVDLLYRVLPGEKRRTPALAVAYVIFIGALVVIGGQIGAQVVEQANALSRRAPEMLARWEAPARSPGTPAPLQ